MITSLHDYEVAKEVESIVEVTFYGILIALIRRADTKNLEQLERIFPEAVKEVKIRYNAPGGALNLEEWLYYYDKGETTSIDREMLKILFEKALEKIANRRRDEDL